ncbi:MAG: hypothetical protein ACREU7_16720 [Burkholderiales bacterium]
MKTTRRLIAALAASLALSAAAAEDGEWRTITVDSGSFSISMPGEPEHNVTRDETPQLGKIEVHTIRYRGTPTTYLVGYVSYASDVPMDPRTEMESNRDHFIQGVGAKVIEQHDIGLEGGTGIEFTAESAGYQIKSRVYFRNNRSYQLIAAVRKGEQDTAAVERFLGSLRLLGKP